MWAGSPNESAIRTTNGAEAFHRHIKESVGNAHPNIFCLANVLLQIQEETYVKLQSSQSVRRMSRSDRENAHAVLTTIGETLDSVSTVFNEIAQHPPHTLFAVCNWSIGHPR